MFPHVDWILRLPHSQTIVVGQGFRPGSEINVSPQGGGGGWIKSLLTLRIFISFSRSLFSSSWGTKSEQQKLFESCDRRRENGNFSLSLDLNSAWNRNYEIVLVHWRFDDRKKSVASELMDRKENWAESKIFPRRVVKDTASRGVSVGKCSPVLKQLC